MSAGDFPLTLPISGTAKRVIYMAALSDDHARRKDGSSHMVKLYVTAAEAEALKTYLTGLARAPVQP